MSWARIAEVESADPEGLDAANRYVYRDQRPPASGRSVYGVAVINEYGDSSLIAETGAVEIP